ncbi:MAG: alternate-type signal peptide domain-containing protein [Propionibacteriaceae bacterium]
MSKNIKGLIALAAACLLLLGGYGTYALWSDSEPIDGGEVAAGELKLEGATEGTWTDVSAGGEGTPIPNIAEFLIVPGDTLNYSATATVLAKGDNLTATIEADPASITGDAELLADLEVTTEVLVGDGTVAEITEANDGDTVGVTVTLAFSADSTNETQLQSVDLAALELVLQQTRS